MLRQVLMPQHSLVVGNKGSGKSAICRLLCDDLQKVKPLLPKSYDVIHCIPAYGLQSEEFLPELDLLSMEPETVDDFRYFWLLYLGLKVASTLVKDEQIIELATRGDNPKLKLSMTALNHILVD